MSNLTSVPTWQALAACLAIAAPFTAADDPNEFGICDGCVDNSVAPNDPPLMNFNDPLSNLTPIGTVSFTFGIVAEDGICRVQPFDPPWDHISSCRGAVMCAPAVLVQVHYTESILSGFAGQMKYLATGQICNSNVIVNEGMTEDDTEVIFSGTIRMECGTDCEIDLDVEAYMIQGLAPLAETTPPQNGNYASDMGCGPCENLVLIE